MEVQSSAPPRYTKLDNTSPSVSKGQQILDLVEKYEIQPLFSEKLFILSNYDIVLLCDDSGSMNTPLDDNTGHSTRWEELKSVIKIVISIATIFDDDGIDIYFLNRQTQLNVSSFEQVSTCLDEPPYGGTPLTSKLSLIFDNYKYSEKPVLVVIATDGVPTYNGYIDLDSFERCVTHKNHEKFYISFLACSDQDDEIAYLNDLDKNVPNVDTLDDYVSERAEVLAAQGPKFSYKFSEHICRLLLGPLCPELDALDEKGLIPQNSIPLIANKTSDSNHIRRSRRRNRNTLNKNKKQCIIL